MNWLTDAEPRPALLVLPAAAVSLDEADAAIELYEHYSGKTLDPTQRLAVQVMMAQSADDGWAAQTTGREMPRQNGKGDEIECVELWGLTQRAEAILHTLHDAVLLATQAQERMLSTLEGHKDLRRLILRVWKGTGQQMIEMRNGGIVWYRTRTGGGGRGVDNIDRLVIDEAQHATEEQLAAITPTLFANDDPQMNAIGTAGLEGKSVWWWRLRKRALSDDPGSFGYVGHTAENLTLRDDGSVISEVPDVTEHQLWFDCNPALSKGRGRGVEFLDEQLRNLGPQKFAQEHLCVWAPDPGSGSSGPIDPVRWDQLEREAYADDGTVKLALDVPPSRSSASFAIAGRLANGVPHVEMRRHVPAAEMGSLVELAKALVGHYSTPLILVKGSPASAWQSELEEAGVKLDVLSSDEYGQACGLIQAKVAEGTLSQFSSPELRAAVGGLTSVKRGDIDVWARRNADVDIAPFVAVTCALVRVAGKGDDVYHGPMVAIR